MRLDTLMRTNTSLRSFAVGIVMSLAVACARPPQTAYTFDPAPGGWEFARHDGSSSLRYEEYSHPVHNERLEVFEVARPSPGTSAAEFTALAPAARTLPTLGEATTTMRALGDDELAGTAGFWVAQYGRRDAESMQSATFVVPNGRRHFVVRLTSNEDDVEQLQGWLRDTILRNFRFPAAVR